MRNGGHGRPLNSIVSCLQGSSVAMASKAEKTFDESAKDVERLMEIHKSLGGGKVGRRYRLEVLNKSAIVLITEPPRVFRRLPSLSHAAIGN